MFYVNKIEFMVIIMCFMEKFIFLVFIIYVRCWFWVGFYFYLLDIIYCIEKFKFCKLIDCLNIVLKKWLGCMIRIYY